MQHPLGVMGFTDAAFKALVDEPSGLALRGLVATVLHDCAHTVQSSSRCASCVDAIVGEQRRVVRSTLSAELNGVVDRIEGMVALQFDIHKSIEAFVSPRGGWWFCWSRVIYVPPRASPRRMHRLCLIASLRPVHVTLPSFKLHIIIAWKRPVHGIIWNCYWFNARDMVADGRTSGGVDEALLRNMSINCRDECTQDAHNHTTRLGI